jgi:hypothetical protein
MPGSQGGKGNPATKRMSNPRRKERRAASWRRGELRKRAHTAANEDAHKRNLDELEALGIRREMRRKRFDTSRERLETPSEALRRYRREAERRESA